MLLYRGEMNWLDDLNRDVRFAVRAALKTPGFTAVAVLCLALGIGANAAIFSVVDAVLLRPLPFAEPERLVRLYETLPERGADARESASWPNYRDWAEQLKGFNGLAVYTLQGRNLSSPQGAERLRVVEVSARFFQVLGVSPRIGRGFSPGEDSPGASPVVVVSEGFWKRRLGGDAALIGQTLSLDGQPHTVIGILPAAVQFPVGRPVDLFLPFIPTREHSGNRGMHFLSVLGRLRPEVTLEAANTELRQVARQLEEAYPDQQTGRSASALLLTEVVVGKVRPALLFLQGTAAFVLLIACASVANLLLVQAARRRQEIAIRLALGANRNRLLRQLLVESLLLALLGALAGLLLAAWGLSSLEVLIQTSLPLTGGIPLQGRVLGFLLLVAVGCSVLFGLAPALQLTRTDLRASLIAAGAEGASSRSHHRLRSGLVVGELALSLILLVGAGLLLRGFVKLLGTEPGLEARGVLTAHLPAPQSKYPPEQIAERLFKPILESTRSLPGVTAVGLSSLLPMQEASITGDYAVEGEPPPEPGKELLAEYRVASPDFFRTLRVPLLSGREFTEQDGRGELVIIINQALARRHFAEQSAVGRRLLLFGQPATIVGVVGNVRQAGLDQEPLPELTLPYNHSQASAWFFQDGVSLVVKTAVAPESVASALRQAVRSVDSEQPLNDVVALEELIARSVAGRRMNLVLVGGFALVALVLAIAGLSGVIWYLVAQRSREIGIRMALGARSSDVVRLVMRQGVLLALMGVGGGLAGALALSRFIESLLYGVGARDPLTFGGLAVLLGGIALLATWLPARRAASIDPIIAMKSE